MEVGDDHLGLAQFRQQVGRNQVMLAVIVVGIVGQQHPQPVADGDAGRDDQEGIRKAGILRIGHLVQSMPGDQHRHHQRLAAAGGHLEGNAIQQGIGVFVCPAQLILDPGVAIA